MNMPIIYLSVVICISAVAITALIMIELRHIKSLDADVKLKRDMFMFSLPIDESNFIILDNLIRDEINIYQIYNLPSFEDKLYISEKEQQKMLKIILSNVLKKISPIYMNKLKYIYNEEVIEDIIFEKVRDSVMNLTVEINGSLSE